MTRVVATTMTMTTCNGYGNDYGHDNYDDNDISTGHCDCDDDDDGDADDDVHDDGNHDGRTSSNKRKLTAILYLNEDWDASRDGGCLRAYLPGRDGEYRDIEPKGGRLLLFDSTAVEHEVLPTFRTRMALTLWAVNEQ